MELLTEVWALLFLLLKISVVCRTIRITEVFLPKHIVRGGGVTLSCCYDPEDDDVYVIKWYKDNQEFYHFQPSSKPQQITYQVPGLRVNLDRSTLTSVTLRDLDFEAAGLYRCEVSGEAPSFWTVYQEQNISVVALPKTIPVVSSTRYVYRPGETAELNCSSHTPLPPSVAETLIACERDQVPQQPKRCSQYGIQTTIKWFLNDEQVSSDFVQHERFIRTVRRPANESELTSHRGITSRSMLRLPIRRHHFSDGVLSLKCVASIANVYWDSSQVKLYSHERHTAETLRKSSGLQVRLSFPFGFLLLTSSLLTVNTLKFAKL